MPKLTDEQKRFLRAILVSYLDTNPNECKHFLSPDVCIKYGDYTQMCPYKVDDQPNHRCYCKPA